MWVREGNPVQLPDRAGATAGGRRDGSLFFPSSDQMLFLHATNTSGKTKDQIFFTVENMPNTFTYVLHIVIFY